MQQQRASMLVHSTAHRARLVGCGPGLGARAHGAGAVGAACSEREERQRPLDWRGGGALQRASDWHQDWQAGPKTAVAHARTVALVAAGAALLAIGAVGGRRAAHKGRQLGQRRRSESTAAVSARAARQPPTATPSWASAGGQGPTASLCRGPGELEGAHRPWTHPARALSSRVLAWEDDIELCCRRQTQAGDGESAPGGSQTGHSRRARRAESPLGTTRAHAGRRFASPALSC